jgi:hypothetical protein
VVTIVVDGSVRVVENAVVNEADAEVEADPKSPEDWELAPSVEVGIPVGVAEGNGPLVI